MHTRQVLSPQSAAKLQPIERFSIKMQWKMANGDVGKGDRMLRRRPSQMTRHCRRLCEGSRRVLARSHTHTHTHTKTHVCVLVVDEKSQNNWQLIIVNYSDRDRNRNNDDKEANWADRTVWDSAQWQYIDSSRSYIRLFKVYIKSYLTQTQIIYE